MTFDDYIEEMTDNYYDFIEENSDQLNKDDLYKSIYSKAITKS